MTKPAKSKYTVPILLIITAIAIMLAVKAARHFAPGAPLIPADQRKVMSDISLTTLSDEKWSLADHRGKVVLINFFATWCGPCVAETPDLVRLFNENHTRGYESISISLDDQGPQIVRPFVAQYKIPYAVGMLDVTTDWGRPFATTEVPIPLTFLIDKQGRIAKMYQGLTEFPEFNTDIQKLLAE